MWPFLPKKCDCESTPTNVVGDPTCEGANFTSDMFALPIDLFVCAGIEQGDTVSVALQKIDYYLCSLEYSTQFVQTITESQQVYEQFTTLVNGAINCETILDCGPVPPSTTTTSSSSTSTTTTTTTLCAPNLIVNSTFDTNLNGWEQTAPGDWEWTSLGAHYIGRDSGSLLYQEVFLNPGQQYDISITIRMNNPCTLGTWVKLFVGDTEYGPINISGVSTLDLILTATGPSTLFGIQAYDACGEPYDTIYIDNVFVAEHCSEFTTTSTTSTTTTTPCNCFQVFTQDGNEMTVIDCDGIEYQEIFEGVPSTIPPYIGGNSKLYCVKFVGTSSEYFIRDFGPCGPESYCNSTTTTTSSTSTSTSTTTSTSSSTTTSTTTEAPIYLTGTWEIDNTLRANAIEVVQIDEINGQNVSCAGATACSFPISAFSGGYEATPPTVDGINAITISGTTSYFSLTLNWTGFDPALNYYVGVDINGLNLYNQIVTYLQGTVSFTITMNPSDDVKITIYSA